MTTPNDSKIVGKPLDRVDGRLKVTGAAKYSTEIELPDSVTGFVLQSEIAKGRIESIDTRRAMKLSGILDIYTCFNKPVNLVESDQAKNLFLLNDNVIRYAGQMIGLVVAEDLETAKYAASLLKIAYVKESAITDFSSNLANAAATLKENKYKRGEIIRGFSTADAEIEATYTVPAQSHNPMEPFATTAVWEGDTLTLYDSTQAVFASRNTIAAIFGITPDKVRVVAKYTGGGFGCKLTVWTNVVLAAMAARKLKRPVRVVLERDQMFGPVGFRPNTVQTIKMGAKSDGTITAIRHTGFSETARFSDYVEEVTAATKVAYTCENVETEFQRVPLDIGRPTWMRAPGHAPGSFALESAIDELSYKLNMDPLQLRLRNFADRDQEQELPWSSNALRECYRQGADRFGWDKRKPAPKSTRHGHELVGMGMAMALHSCWRNVAAASVKLSKDGTATIESGSQEIGTGTYTVMTQVAAEYLSLPMERVTFKLGDTLLPKSPMSGGSTTAGSVSAAVAQVCQAAMEKLIAAAVADKNSALYGSNKQNVAADSGKLFLKDDPACGESYEAILARMPGGVLEAKFETELGDVEKHYSISSFGAHFAEVRVDIDLGIIRLSRFIGVYDGGRILNVKTARSQLLGGIVFGVGMALTEQLVIDHQFGKIINKDLGEYHLPVHADIREVEAYFVEENDPHINIMGVKGLGELGITGASAAIANAVYHATGVRVRDLPITLDKLL